MKNDLEISNCLSNSDFTKAKQITIDYLNWLGMDLDYQDVSTELLGLQNMYGPPNGCFLLAISSGVLAGGVGLRKLEKSVCEMKRLFVYPKYQNKGIGEKLCLHLIKEAKELGYASMKLDTVAKLNSAIRLYEKLGCTETEQYCENPDPTAKFFELRLTNS